MQRKLTVEEIEGGVLLHTIKVWAPHRRKLGDRIKIQDAEYIVDLVKTGEISWHRVDGSCWKVLDDGAWGVDICIDDDPPQNHLEALTEKQLEARAEAMPSTVQLSETDLEILLEGLGAMRQLSCFQDIDAKELEELLQRTLDERG